jgi:hypothetical protein
MPSTVYLQVYISILVHVYCCTPVLPVSQVYCLPDNYEVAQVYCLLCITSMYCLLNVIVHVYCCPCVLLYNCTAFVTGVLPA